MKKFNENLLERTGGSHILIVIAVSQIVGLLGIFPGYFTIQLITIFDDALNQAFSSLLPMLIVISQVIFLGLAWQSTPNARSRLNEHHTDNKKNSEKELAAWKEITNLTTRHGISMSITNLLIVVIPLFVVSLSWMGTTSIPYYILLAGLSSILGSVILTLLLIERFTLPDRLALLPKDFESQLNGRTGASLGTKFQSLILSLITIGITVIAPLGYQQALRIINAESNQLQILGELQFQAILISGLVLFLGITLSLLATRSISDPIKELVETFQKVEQGDLNQRVPVTGTDELATVAVHFNRMVARLDELQSTLEEQVALRTKQLTASNEVGRVASSILDPDELISKIVYLITEQFNYYYGAIYLLDSSGKWAELKEATGQVGNVLKQNRHRLEITGNSMVALCIREKSPRIAQNTADEKQRFENPLLPYTRSEVALPLYIGDKILGALDVQSTKQSDFGRDVIETMQNMVGQVAIALENARLFQEAQQSIAELRAIQKQYLLEGWASIKTYNEDLEYGIGEAGEVSGQILEASIDLRDQTLGKVILEQNNEWSPEQQGLVNAVTTQAAIALENARLVSESRQVALKERALSEINSKIWASNSIDAILQTVVKELGKRLDTSSTTIELKMDDDS